MNYLKNIPLITLLIMQTAFPLTSQQNAMVNAFVNSKSDTWQEETVALVKSLLAAEPLVINRDMLNILEHKWNEEKTRRGKYASATGYVEMRPEKLPKVIFEAKTYLLNQDQRSLLGSYIPWIAGEKPKKLTAQQRTDLEKILNGYLLAKELLALDSALFEIEKLYQLPQRDKFNAFTNVKNKLFPDIKDPVLKQAFSKALYNFERPLAQAAQKMEPAFDKLYDAASRKVLVERKTLHQTEVNDLLDKALFIRFSPTPAIVLKAQQVIKLIITSRALEELRAIPVQLDPHTRAIKAENIIKEFREGMYGIKIDDKGSDKVFMDVIDKARAESALAKIL